MDKSGQKHTSKWDLIDGQRNVEDSGQEIVRSENYHSSSNEYKSYSCRYSSAYAAGNDAKYPTDAKDVRSKYDHAVSVRDHASVNRGAWKDSSLDRGNRRLSEARTNWDADGSRRDHDRSSRNGWKRQRWSTSKSRSRSRSPICAYRHESGVNDRPRNKLEVPIQTCRDFTTGRCRRGSHCPLLHPSTENYEDRRYDFKHREESVRGGKYLHHNASDGYYNDYTGEALEPRRDHDRNRRGESFNHGVDRAPRRSSDVPCTFFAAGNCRNGKFCHFSHQIPSTRNSEGREHDGRWKTNHSPEKFRQMDRATKFSDTVDQQSTEYEREGRWRTNHSSDRVDQINRGQEFVETADRHVEYGKESHGKDVSPQSRREIPLLSMNSGWGNNIERSYVTRIGLASVNKEVEVKASSQWNTDNPGNISTASEVNAVDNWVGDKIAPEWNQKVSSARTVAKEEPAYVIQTSKSDHHSVPPHSSQLTHYVSSVMTGVVENQSFKQNLNLINEAGNAFSYDRNLGGNTEEKFSSNFSFDNSSKPSTHNVTNGAPGNLNEVGEQQFPLTPNHSGNQNASAFRSLAANYDIYSIKSNYDDLKTSEANAGATHASKMESQEQFARLTDFSVSLAHLLDKGQQIPQFYAALNLPNPVTSFDISNGNVSHFPVGTVQPYPPSGSKTEYEPVCDNAGQMQPNSSITIGQYPPNPGMLRTNEEAKQEIHSGEQNTCEPYQNGHGKGNLSLKPDSNSKPIQKPQTIHEEITKGKDKHAKSREGSPVENVEGEAKDGGKKVKDIKVLRDFKYALVNFVKDLLKPAWKDGKIDKDGFKTIVKKATDKVTATIQDANIPQTPEKVEQYLSASKPKLKKLLQAYVDRNQKKQT